jgi:subtilisin family serine protease
MDVGSIRFFAKDSQKLYLISILLLFILSSCQKEKTTESVFAQSADPCLGAANEKRYIVQWEDGRFSIENGESKEQFKNTFVKANLAGIKKVQTDYQLKVFSEDKLNSYSKKITQFQAQLETPTWHIYDIGADKVWEQNVKGSGVLVGVVDAWIDRSHPQLKTRLHINDGEIANNGIDDDGNGYIDDYDGYDFSPDREKTDRTAVHGSHVAGIVLADPNEGLAQGVAPEAKLIAAPFMVDSGSGSLGDAILALQYTADQGAKIINNSWGSCGKVEVLENAFKEISDRGVLIVTAAGNEGVDVDNVPVFPSSYNLPNQLNIAASGVDGYMTYWSNRGFRKVQFAAPGDNIFSIIPFAATEEGSGYLSGTSMSAPVVSGAAALLWSAFPEATANQIRSALVSSVEVVPGKENRTETKGKLNVYNAYEKLKQNLLK